MKGTQVLNNLELDSEDGAVALGGDFVVVDVAAAVNRAGEVFAPRFDPLDGFVDLHGDETHQGFFSVDIELAAETATNFGSHDAQTVFFEAEHRRHQSAHQMGNLGGGVDRQSAVCAAPLSGNASRFHRHGYEALTRNALLYD